MYHGDGGALCVMQQL